MQGLTGLNQAELVYKLQNDSQTELIFKLIQG